MTFGSGEWALKAKVTRRAQFLGEMEQVIAWERVLALIEFHYPKASTGRRPHPMARMLRIYFMQQWFNLSDPAMEDALYDSESIRGFADIDLTWDVVHSLVTGPANEADITRLNELLHGEEAELFGDQAYWSEDHRRHCQAAGIRYRVNRRPRPSQPLTARQREEINGGVRDFV